MAKFRFNLEAALEQRRAAERVEQRRVAALEAERLGLEAELRAMQEGLRACKADWRDALGSPESARVIDLTGVRLRSGESFRLFAGAQRVALRLAGAYKRLEVARGELLRATTARRAIELLKERRYEEWRRQEARREAGAQDEMAVMRFGRGPGGEPGSVGRACEEATA